MWDLAAGHRELVAQHEDLQVRGGIATGEQRQQLDGTARRDVCGLRCLAGCLLAIAWRVLVGGGVGTCWLVFVVSGLASSLGRAVGWRHRLLPA